MYSIKKNWDKWQSQKYGQIKDLTLFTKYYMNKILQNLQIRNHSATFASNSEYPGFCLDAEWFIYVQWNLYQHFRKWKHYPCWPLKKEPKSLISCI